VDLRQETMDVSQLTMMEDAIDAPSAVSITASVMEKQALVIQIPDLGKLAT